jgi:hypothetical protein
MTSHFDSKFEKILSEMPTRYLMAASDRVINETLEIKGTFQDSNRVRYKICKLSNGYQAYYSLHDDDEFELKIEDVPYTPHLGLRSNDQSATSATLINQVRSEIKNLYDIMNKPEYLDELPAQVQNAMQYVQILAEYLEITVSKLPSHEPIVEIVTTSIRDLRDTSQQILQISANLQEDEIGRKFFISSPESFEGNRSYKEYLRQLSILLPRIHHQVNSIYGEVNANQVFSSSVSGDTSGNRDMNYATLTATIGVVGESDHMGDSYAFNSVSIYNDYINDIKDPTDQEILSMLISIMGDESIIGYIERVISKRY